MKQSIRLNLVAAALLALSASASAAPQDDSIYIKLMPQTRSDYIQVQVVNNSVYSFQLFYLLQGTDSAVSMTSTKDPNYPTTCQTTLAEETTCSIWLHSTNNKQLGPVQEGKLFVQAAYDGVIVTQQTFALSNENDLYVGGDFHNAINSDGSKVTVNNIAKWNGTTWSALGDGITTGHGVLSLTIGADGAVYAGGYFSQVGGVAANNIAKWDPITQQWSALGNSILINSYIFGLTTGTDGAVYAGQVGGVTANNIAKWDPTSQQWSALGDGINSNVSSLARGTDGSIYAGGHFSQAGGVAANNIAKWNPTTQQWSTLGDGTDGNVYSLTIGTDGAVYAGGLFSTSSIAKWSPTAQQWSTLGDGINGKVYSLTTGTDGSIYAGGYFSQAGGVAANNIAKWNPTTQQWSTLGNGITEGNSVNSLTTSVDGAVYVGGDFIRVNGAAAMFIAKWDPTTQQWSTLGNGVDYMIDAMVISKPLLSAIVQ